MVSIWYFGPHAQGVSVFALRVFWICVRPRSIGSQAAGCPCANGFGVRPWCRGSVRGARFVERLSERGAKSIKLLPNKKGRRVPPRMTSSLGLSSSLGFFSPLGRLFLISRTFFTSRVFFISVSGFPDCFVLFPGSRLPVGGFSTHRGSAFRVLLGFPSSGHLPIGISDFLGFWISG